MPTTYKIHPAIGIARVGNSPDEFFVGPERIGERPEPPGGFKDAACRVKRQAARFRIFAYHDDETVEEITAADAEITWTVHVANKKAAYSARGNPEPAADLTIDPGSRTLSGLNSSADFDGGTIAYAGETPVEVPLGSMRTDDDGRLLVLGGSGNSDAPGGQVIGNFWNTYGWYDDVADGPVTATVQLHGSTDVEVADGAWVLVAPPKFAPDQDSVTTLYDRLLQTMIDSGLVASPATTSYTNDVYPILKRAEDMAWVEGLTTNHVWSHPVTDQTSIDAIMSRVENPAGGGGNMPKLYGTDSTLTVTQYAHLERWQNGTYANDWIGVPTPEPEISPAGLDRAALEAAVGAAFYPGIEAGGRFAGQRPILETVYAEAFRIDHGGAGPGDISASMALPWQADFKACQDSLADPYGDTWWPVPRPNDVFVDPAGTTQRWDDGVSSMQEMVTEWSQLGFVVRQGDMHLQVERCDTQSIELLTPTLDFVDVAQGPMGTVREVPLAITFEVTSAASPVTLEYAPGGAPSHVQLVAINTSDTVGPTTADGVATAHLWIVFRTGGVGAAIPPQVLTVQEPVSGRTWEVVVNGNTVARATTAVGLALDRSGSMSQDRGDGQSKHDSLQEAANLFVDLMLEGDGCGIARFNQDADALVDVLQLGDGMLSDTNRTAVHDAIDGNGLDPVGATSIGDGIHEARSLLDNAIDTYDRDALVVLTDGIENRERWIADVAADIDARTYAIGLGRPEDISVAALQTISGNSGGYTLITGPITGDNRYRLQKQFLQILAGINNAEVALDPDGELRSGQIVKIPFMVSEADTGIEVVLLTPAPDRIDFRLLTPMGQLIEPWHAINEPTMHYGTSDQAAFYRVALPIRIEPGRFDQVGKWYAVFRIGKPRIDPRIDRPDRDVLRVRRRVVEHGRHRPLLSEGERRFELIRSHATGDVGAPSELGAEAAIAARARELPAAANRRTQPYSLVVHTYSSVSLEASVDQNQYQPGAMVDVMASVRQSGLPVERATVWADVTEPNGETSRHGLQLAGSGRNRRYQVRFQATRPGVHHVRVRAKGLTRLGHRFTREQTLTAQVWKGADRPGDLASNPHPPTGVEAGNDGPDRHDPIQDLCRLLWCLVGPDGALDDKLLERLARRGVDVERVWKCLDACVKKSGR